MNLNKLPLTVTIITKNEQTRIVDAIKSVETIASQIVVVDSGSVDQTVELAKSLGAEVYINSFLGFGQQKNFAHSKARFEWVLNLDADERVSSKLLEELTNVITDTHASETDKVYGYSIPRMTWYYNRWIKHCGWYPNYLVRLSRKSTSSWSEPKIHESLEVQGKVLKLKNPIEHFSFPNQKSHILKNIQYAELAKNQLIMKGRCTNLFDLTVRPVYKFFDIYFLKLGFLDGLAGFLIAIHSAYALFLRYAYLYEQTTQNTHHR